MFLLSPARQAVRHTIATYRRSAPMIALHKAAEFFEAAWHNDGSDLANNGERTWFRRTKSSDQWFLPNRWKHRGSQ
jgi:hypothetical protein